MLRELKGITSPVVGRRGPKGTVTRSSTRPHEVLVTLQTAT